MKNFITGLFLVIVIIAVIVLAKRIRGDDKPIVNNDDSETSDFGLDSTTSIDINSNGVDGETLPQ